MKKHLSLILVLLPVLFLALPALAQERKKVGVVLSEEVQRGSTYPGTESHRRSRHSNRLYSRYQYGIHYRRIILYRIYSSAIGQHGAQTGLDVLTERPVKRSAMSLNEREKSEKYVFSFPFTKSPKDAVSGGIIKGQNLANLFTELTVGYHDSVDFNKLPIPLCLRFTKYRKWRTDCVPQWNTCHSYAGQYAIPGVFTPVRKDSMILMTAA